MDVLTKLFEQHFGTAPEQVQPLQGQLGGSGRVIVRLATTKSRAIGILYNVREENVAFIEFSRHFRKHGLPVPEIFAQELNAGAYLEEDLGDTTLFDLLSRNRSGDEIAPPVIEAYREVMPRCRASKSKRDAISTTNSAIRVPASIASQSRGT